MRISPEMSARSEWGWREIKLWGLSSKRSRNEILRFFVLWNRLDRSNTINIIMHIFRESVYIFWINFAYFFYWANQFPQKLFKPFLFFCSRAREENINKVKQDIKNRKIPPYDLFSLKIIIQRVFLSSNDFFQFFFHIKYFSFRSFLHMKSLKYAEIINGFTPITVPILIHYTVELFTPELRNFRNYQLRSVCRAESHRREQFKTMPSSAVIHNMYNPFL